MNQSKLKLTTIIALTAFTVAVIPACLQRKSANAASKYTYKKGFTYEKISPNIEKRITGKSYRKNNNIKLSDLRYVQVLHYGFDGKVKEGELIVNKKIAKKTVKVFYALYQKIRGSKEIRYHRQMGRCINRERRQNVKENIKDI